MHNCLNIVRAAPRSVVGIRELTTAVLAIDKRLFMTTVLDRFGGVAVSPHISILPPHPFSATPLSVLKGVLSIRSLYRESFFYCQLTFQTLS